MGLKENGPRGESGPIGVFCFLFFFSFPFLFYYFFIPNSNFQFNLTSIQKFKFFLTA
jgi:hypothetical protein